MANMISNNNNNTKNAMNSSGIGGSNSSGKNSGSSVNNLRDVCNFLQPAAIMNPVTLPPGSSPYDHIIDMMRGLDLQDDGIMMNHKIKSIETDFCNIVRDENMLCESMEYINDIALSDGETALKFALLFSSRNFDALAMKDTKVRSAMLKILETNFLNADTYRLQDKERLYNSITLLGEYYHRVRLADNSPIIILGESLLVLLIREVSELEAIDVKLAKLILSQITLNGDIMRVKHKADLTLLLYHIRRNLIEQPALKAAVKALLLMTLDLYYSNFANLGTQLEDMYTKYLVLEDDDEGNNNLYAQPQTPHQLQQHPQNSQTVHFTPQQQQQVVAAYHAQLHQQQQQHQPPQSHIPSQFHQSQQMQQSQQPITEYDMPARNNLPYSNDLRHFENGGSVPSPQQPQQQQQQQQQQKSPAHLNSSVEENQMPVIAKKWSEQVCEEAEFGNDYNGDTTETGEQQVHSSNSTPYEDERHTTPANRNSRRSYNNGHSPRPLRQNHHESNEKNEFQRKQEQHYQQQQQQQQSGGEELDDAKPLPRWRAPRFNRDPNEHQNNRHQQRRYSASFDDDGQSVRSEGGSIRLYSVNDRLKHSQEKIANTSNNNYSYIANSNWDRQSQRDDRSERSYISNYEMGNYRRRGPRGQSNRQTYDKPPRFQKQQQQQHQNSNSNNNNKDNKIHSDSWRRSQHYNDDRHDISIGGGESNSRSSSRARTLPRPAKSNWAGGDTYRRSQSPNFSGHMNNNSNNNNQQHYRSTGGPRPRHFNARYSSQSSLASEASSTLDRRHNQQQQHQRNRNYSRRSSNPRNQQIETWDDGDSHSQPASLAMPPPPGDADTRDSNSELVRNAQQTTKYMNYLSSK